MRILHLNHTGQMSGGERSLMLLLRGLPDSVIAILACPAGPLVEAAHAAEVPCTPVTGTAGSLKLHPVYTPVAIRDVTRAALEVRRACDELGVELVHANSIRAGLIAAIARRLGGPPTIAHIRDVLPESALSSATMRVLYAGADAIVANSRYTSEQLPDTATRPPVSIVHNPVDLRSFNPDQTERFPVRRELGLTDATQLLTVVAQITPWKGQETAVRALADLRGRGHDVHLALAGSAKFVDKATRFDNEAYLRRLHELATELKVEGQVSFLGEREDVPAIMAATDVLLMPSSQEPFGRALIEAMAMGVPVVSTDVGGPPEIVTDGVHGLLVPPGHPGPWVDALHDLLSNPVLLRQMGDAGRERARIFALGRHVEAMLRVYGSIARGAEALAA